MVKEPRTKGRPSSEGVAAIESKLLSIALEEFLAHGYGAASMSRIVKNAGVSKTTLYSRYPSKGELFLAIIEAQIERLSPSTSIEPHTSPPDLVAGLKSYGNRTLEHNLREDFMAVNRLIYSESHRFPELGAAAAGKNRLGIKRISEFILECAKADGLTCKDPEVVAEIFIYMLRGWYINLMLSNRKATAKEREQWVERAVTQLLAGRKDW